jgi:hypothetical protein
LVRYVVERYVNASGVAPSDDNHAAQPITNEMHCDDAPPVPRPKHSVRKFYTRTGYDVRLANTPSL